MILNDQAEVVLGLRWMEEEHSRSHSTSLQMVHRGFRRLHQDYRRLKQENRRPIDICPGGACGKTGPETTCFLRYVASLWVKEAEEPDFQTLTGTV